MAFAYAQHLNFFFLALAEVCQQISVRYGFDQLTVTTAMLLKLVLLHSAGIFKKHARFYWINYTATPFLFRGTVTWNDGDQNKRVGEISVDRLANFHMPN